MKTNDLGRKATMVFSRVVLYLWCAFSVFAFLWIALCSLKTNNEFFGNAWGLPAVPQWGNYIKVLTDYSLGKNFMNSLLIVVFSVVGIVAISAPAAYILARFDFKGVGFLGKFFTLGMGVPFQLLLIPLFFILFDFKMVGTYAGLIIVYIALSIPFTIFLIQGFFRSLPSVLEEAAYIDGAGFLRTFFQIMMPCAKGGLTSAAVLCFLNTWNEFTFSLILTSSESARTLPLSLSYFTSQFSFNYTALFAAVTIAVIPSIIVFAIFQEQVVSSLTAGSVKE